MPWRNISTNPHLEHKKTYVIYMLAPASWDAAQVKITMEHNPPGLVTKGTFAVNDVNGKAVPNVTTGIEPHSNWRVIGTWYGSPIDVPVSTTSSPKQVGDVVYYDLLLVDGDTITTQNWIDDVTREVKIGKRYRFVVLGTTDSVIATFDDARFNEDLVALGWAVEKLEPAPADFVAALAKVNRLSAFTARLITAQALKAGVLPTSQVVPITTPVVSVKDTLYFGPIEKEAGPEEVVASPSSGGGGPPWFMFILGMIGVGGAAYWWKNRKA